MDLKSNEPFWLVKNGIIQSYPSLRENLTCEVLVVGGGITGSLIAHQCIEDGYDTVLIDKREIGFGSSSATTSMLQYEIDTPLHKLMEDIGEEDAIASYKACSDGIDRLEKICQEIKSKAGFKRKQSLYFAAFKKDVSGLKKELEARRSVGFDVQWMDAEAIEKAFDIVGTYGGILSTQGASVDAFKLVHELLDFNSRRGLRVFDKTELTKTTYRGATHTVSLDTGVRIKAKKIIYCVGYESVSLIREKFVDLISTYAIVSEVSPVPLKKYDNLLVWNTADPYIYLRTTDDGRMLIGGEDEPFRDPQRRDRLLDKKTARLEASAEKYLAHVPFIADFSWAGTFGQTKDGLPYVGTHDDFEKCYFVLGFGGNGITFSVAGMEMVARWLKGKKHPLERCFGFGR